MNYSSKIETAFANFNIEVNVESVIVGSSVTTYAIKLGKGVRVRSINDMETDIAIALGTSGILFDVNFGNGLIGIQVPNETRGKVLYNDFASSNDLNVVIGKDIIGNEVRLDIAKMPHLLIAGQTGSGKSVVLNTIICSLMENNSPDQVKVILIDPKKVEFTPYSDIPHLDLPVLTQMKDIIEQLKALVELMETRYAIMEKFGVRNINDMPISQNMYKIVLIVDELGDIMLQDKKNIEAYIVRLAQKSRACGIHMVLATQRPSVDVVTGLIKANIPARICCKVSSAVDSEVVLDQVGAENLLGQGDMIFSNGNTFKRIQGAWISDNDINDVITRISIQYPIDRSIKI